MRLSNFVNIYRAAGTPPLNSGSFEAALDFNNDNYLLVKKLRDQSKSAFDEIVIDGKYILGSDDFPKSGEKIEVVVRLPGDSANRFHQNISDFLKAAPKISKGEMPNDFYIIEQDYYSNESLSLKQIENLTAICLLIDKLSKLAHYHDANTSPDHFNLVFLQPEKTESARPIELVTKIDESMLDFEPPDACLIDDLCNGDIKTDPHFVAKKGVFGVTLTEFMTKRPSNQSDFAYLVQNWQDFILLYQNNLGTYLSGFAFHKAKREVAEAELKVAEQFSKITSDITGKLLSIPVSFAVVIAVTRSDSLFEGSLLVLGLLLAALVLSGTVRNQQKQFKRISHSKEIIFDSFEGRKKSYPEELKQAISVIIAETGANETYLRRTLWTFRVLGWIPVIIGTAILVYNHYPF